MSPSGRSQFDGPQRAPARAMLLASGFTARDLKRPIIGVANTWTEIGPCNYHLRDLAAAVRRADWRAGGATEFTTVTISDATTGTAGCGVAREPRSLADPSSSSRAAPVRRSGLPGRLRQDALPGAAMAVARLDLPGMVYYGPIAPANGTART
jgi:dihydroxy-acid dehydratase